MPDLSMLAVDPAADRCPSLGKIVFAQDAGQGPKGIAGSWIQSVRMVDPLPDLSLSAELRFQSKVGGYSDLGPASAAPARD
jgi:hypothetical protein